MHPDIVRAIPISNRLRVALGLFVLSMVVGTAGFMVLSGMTLVDAFYQTVTTLSTVGFRELAPFGTTEKLFTSFLILFGVGTVLYTLTTVVQEALEGDIRSRYYRRRVELEIEKLSGHYVLCGFGRVGAEIARELSQRGEPFVIVEQTPAEAERARAFGYMVVDGDATQERTLVQASLSRARCLFAAGDSDAVNTFITLSAKSINPSCYVVARVAAPHNEEKLRLAGADRVLSLYSLGGRRMVLSALQPSAAEFMDTMAAGRSGDLILAEFEVSRRNGFVGLTCAALVRGAGHATLLGIRRRDGDLSVGPSPDAVLEEGDIVIVMAEESDIAKMNARA